MRREPMFIRFINGEVSAVDIINSFLSMTQHRESKNIAEEACGNPPDLSLFRRDFKKAVNDVIDSGLNNIFINYVNSYMKPSLLEVVDNSNQGRASERREVFLKEEKTPWVEALVCYNMSLYIRVYGISEIKCCPVCNKFFTNKGKYAKYCSEICKKSKAK